MRQPIPGLPESGLTIGGRKEEFALRYLQRRGLRLVTRNYRCRQGEIDLVMRDGDCLAFVEVRYRKSQGFGSPAESVTRTKQQRIILAARHYLQHHPTALDCRFDVLALTGAEQIEWLKNAFTE
jgi:putative endonuclease